MRITKGNDPIRIQTNAKLNKCSIQCEQLLHYLLLEDITVSDKFHVLLLKTLKYDSHIGVDNITEI